MTGPPPPLACTKVADLGGDMDALRPYTTEIDADPRVLEGQHPIRRWEYAMTLRTLELWRAAVKPTGPLWIVDVGGAGSGFWRCLASRTPQPVFLVDPMAPHEKPEGSCVVYRGRVEEWTASIPPGGPGKADIVTCISVIEHVEAVPAFLQAIHKILRPGGLLCLTTDYWDAEGPDTAHFHWMRVRIYNKPSLQRLLASCQTWGFQRFGLTEYTYAGPQVYDYAVCSVALTKTGTPR